jgi:DinB superfamily
MRWKPDVEQCPQCGFSWSMPLEGAIALVAQAPTTFREAAGRRDARKRPQPEVWSPAEYLWHMVDVIRIGTERLWIALLDPDAGIPCWDADALADVRQYSALSPRVGLRALQEAVQSWRAAAAQISPDATVEHPEFGTLSAADIIRRNAHEVHHHSRDMGARHDPP